jgi:hypothetical protein
MNDIFMLIALLVLVDCYKIRIWQKKRTEHRPSKLEMT